MIKVLVSRLLAVIKVLGSPLPAVIKVLGYSSRGDLAAGRAVDASHATADMLGFATRQRWSLNRTEGVRTVAASSS